MAAIVPHLNKTFASRHVDNPVNAVFNVGMSDAELIDKLGGAAKLAELLGYDKDGGVQRVHNWRSRGIPARVKLDHAVLFLEPATGRHVEREA